MAGSRSSIGVAGAGSIGTGVAQIAASAGHRVVFYDVNPRASRSAMQQIEKSLAWQCEKKRITQEAMHATLERIEPTEALTRFADCELVIEAVTDELTVKRELLRRVEEVAARTCMLASTTSLNSITAVAAGLQTRGRFLGLHFFNPAILVPLVEIVRGFATDEAVLVHAKELVESWGKTSVTVKDSPGFIVNRLGRVFFLEGLRICEEGLADPATIDWAVRESGILRLGPFEMMDLIGNDIEYELTETVFRGFSFAPRFMPSRLHKQLVDAGALGRKTGRGFFEYGEHAVKPQVQANPGVGRMIVDRMLSVVANEAARVLSERIATVEDIDLAMIKATGFPKGPFQWADENGLGTVVDGLNKLYEEYGEERFRPFVLLKRMAADGTVFYPAKRA